MRRAFEMVAEDYKVSCMVAAQGWNVNLIV